VLDGAGGCEAFLGNYSEWSAKKAARAAATSGGGGGSAGGGASAGKAAAAKVPPKQAAPVAAKPAAAAPAGGGLAPGPSKRSGVNGVVKPAGGPAGAPAGGGGKSKWSWMRVEQLEEKIEFLSGELADLDKELADPEIWADYERADRVQTKRDEVKSELEGLEAEWVRKAE